MKKSTVFFFNIMVLGIFVSYSVAFANLQNIVSEDVKTKMDSGETLLLAKASGTPDPSRIKMNEVSATEKPVKNKRPMIIPDKRDPNLILYIRSVVIFGILSWITLLTLCCWVISTVGAEPRHNAIAVEPVRVMTTFPPHGHIAYPQDHQKLGIDNPA